MTIHQCILQLSSVISTLVLNRGQANLISMKPQPTFLSFLHLRTLRLAPNASLTILLARLRHKHMMVGQMLPP